MATEKNKSKIKNQQKIVFLAIAAIAAIAGVFLLFYSPSYTTSNQSSLPTMPASCGNLQVSVNSVQEATAYYRYGIAKPASNNYKFEIFDLTATNIGSSTKDFSGFKLNLQTSDGTSYLPTEFSSIEKITLLDNTTVNNSCSELALASASRLVLNSGQSASGCKIYQILSSQKPALFWLYDTSGLRCEIQI